MIEDYKLLFDAIEDLKQRSREGWVIIVEGAKDVKSLRNLGVEGEIIVFSGYSSTADAVGRRNAIILTDDDPKGREIERGLMRVLQTYGRVPDVEIKRKIFLNIKKDISTVEELYSFVLKVKNSK